MYEKAARERIVFGYSRDVSNRFIIHPIQSITVKLIHELYADGDSMGDIKARLEACGIPSPYNYSKWGKQVISKILSYERYLGNEVYPAIIDQELYDRVQAVRQSRAK